MQLRRLQDAGLDWGKRQNMKYILAHDLGTSGNKATLYDEQGSLVKSTVAGYPTTFFNGNWAEQDPEDWWRAVCSSTRQLLEEVDTSAISAVSFSGHMMGCLPLDRDGNPLRPHILYCDQRGTPQEKRLKELIDPHDFYAITGHRPSASYTLEKLMWIRDNEPAIYAGTYKVLNAKDYIAYRLTGTMATDFSDAGGTELFDIHDMCWSERLADIAGIDLEKMPDAFDSTHILGEVTTAASIETGIPAGTPVCLGAGDGCACGVGAGSVSPGAMYTSIGSSAWVAVSTTDPFLDPLMRMPTFPHAVPGLYHSCGAMQTAGASFAWAREEVFGSAYDQHDENPYALMDPLIDRAGPGSHGLIFLPYLMGERAPWWDNDAKGCYLGITQETTRGDLLRAVQEGVSFNLRIILDAYREYIPASEMTFVGGAAKSDIWTDILADICQISVSRPCNIEECASMGAAIIGGVGVGLFQGFDSLQDLFQTRDTRDPDPERAAAYESRFEVFQQAYHALKNLFPRL